MFFRHSYHMEGHMNLIKYIVALLEFAKDQIELDKSQLNTQQKQHIKIQINIISKIDEDNSNNFIEEI